MAHGKKGFGIFISTFCISFVILSALFLLFMLYTKTTKVETVKPDVPAAHVCTTDENMTAVLFGCKKAADPPGFVLLLAYHAPQSELQLLVLPPETVCWQNGREDTLEGCYDYEGIRGALNAAKEILDVDIQRYLRADGEGLAALTDFLGGVEYEVPGDFETGGEAFWAGKQLLDGRRLNALLFAGDAYGAADTAWQRELSSLLLQTRLDVNLAQNYDRLTAAIFSCCETNLSQYDFLVRREGLTASLEEGRLNITPLVLEGSYSANHTRFTPEEESLAVVRDAINGKKE